MAESKIIASLISSITSGYTLSVGILPDSDRIIFYFNKNGGGQGSYRIDFRHSDGMYFQKNNGTDWVTIYYTR